MKTRIKGLALSAMLLSSAGMTQAEERGNLVGDLPGFGEEAYFHEDGTYASPGQIRANPLAEAESPFASGGVKAASGFVGDAHVGDLPAFAEQNGLFQPTSYDQIEAGLPAPGHSYINPPLGAMPHSEEIIYGGEMRYEAPGYEIACDDACDSAFAKKSRLFSLLDDCCCDCWGTTEALIWFAPDRRMPALITTSDPQTLPVLPEGGDANVQTVFGDDIDGEVSGGVRLDYGKYLTENVGIGARFWWMANNDDSYYAEGDGSDRSIGRPFYNVDIPANDALLVALDGVFTGAIAARSELKLWAAEAYGRLKLTCTNSSRMDLIGGYSHFEIDDTLGISSVTVTNATARVREYLDLFETENRFDGGQVGFEMVMTHGRWTARSLTKVHLGNMNQRVRIAGISTDQTPPAAVNVTSGGLLAMGNQGEYERNEFSFVPEANFKIGYQLRKNVSLTAGYTLIYWDNVCLVGDIIDASVDGSTLNTGRFGTRPAFEFEDSSLWVQGIDLGLVIEL
jgi:hypothetical protein